MIFYTHPSVYPLSFFHLRQYNTRSQKIWHFSVGNLPRGLKTNISFSYLFGIFSGQWSGAVKIQNLIIHWELRKCFGFASIFILFLNIKSKISFFAGNIFDCSSFFIQVDSIFWSIVLWKDGKLGSAKLWDRLFIWSNLIFLDTLDWSRHVLISVLYCTYYGIACTVSFKNIEIPRKVFGGFDNVFHVYLMKEIDFSQWLFELPAK